MVSRDDILQHGRYANFSGVEIEWGIEGKWKGGKKGKGGREKKSRREEEGNIQVKDLMPPPTPPPKVS